MAPAQLTPPQIAAGQERTLHASTPGVRSQALLVSPYRSDRVALDRIFQTEGWQLFSVKTLGSAREFLRRRSVPLVITERDLPLADWKELLLETISLHRAPRLVVISRMADERLWAEVLNLGGHDVLAKPLSESEVLRVFQNAFSRNFFQD